jgi:hypothetical protein
MNNNNWDELPTAACWDLEIWRKNQPISLIMGFVSKERGLSINLVTLSDHSKAGSSQSSSSLAQTLFTG